MPGRIIIDNPKCAITRACYHDPTVQRAYAEAAEGYGFSIDPCPPRDPQKKGRVESGIKYVLEILQPHHQAGGLAGTAVVRAVQRPEGLVESLPVQDPGKPDQLMALIEQVFQAVSEEIVGIRGGGLSGAHPAGRNCRELTVNDTGSGNSVPCIQAI